MCSGTPLRRLTFVLSVATRLCSMRFAHRLRRRSGQPITQPSVAGTLPEELLIIIFRLLHPHGARVDTELVWFEPAELVAKTLLAASRVCRAWREPATVALFRNARPVTATATLQLSRALSQRPDLAPHVASLALPALCAPRPSKFLRDVHRLILPRVTWALSQDICVAVSRTAEAAVNVELLELPFDIFWYSRAISSCKWLWDSFDMNKLVQLKITNPDTRGEFRLWDTALPFPMLRSLCLEHAYVDTFEVDVYNPHFHSPSLALTLLTELVLDRVKITYLWHFVYFLRHISTLRRFRMYDTILLGGNEYHPFATSPLCLVDEIQLDHAKSPSQSLPMEHLEEFTVGLSRKAPDAFPSDVPKVPQFCHLTIFSHLGYLGIPSHCIGVSLRLPPSLTSLAVFYDYTDGNLNIGLARAATLLRQLPEWRVQAQRLDRIDNRIPWCDSKHLFTWRLLGLLLPLHSVLEDMHVSMNIWCVHRKRNHQRLIRTIRLARIDNKKQAASFRKRHWLRR
ncbi:hypothetical protein BKA62DRAFT_710160 [Auriculariales sp. MPI-PUGE-AT-0066]|nr:hypothetical protein BKA62DRAFT_710160 [Auriculariales sp. MPI-PUGE-AT-0066]